MRWHEISCLGNTVGLQPQLVCKHIMLTLLRSQPKAAAVAAAPDIGALSSATDVCRKWLV